MKTQDKELDELFRSKLEDYELKPSVSVWACIDGELAKGRRRKFYIPILSIAASILILLTIGFLFIPKKPVLGVKATFQSGMVKTSEPVVKSVSNESITNRPQPNKNDPATTIYTNNSSEVEWPVKPEDSTKNEGNTILKNDEQLASINTSKTEIITPVLPGENTGTTSIQPIQIKTPLTVEPQQTVATLPTITEKSQAAKHNTLSLGGFINAMVAKVDKRQDKIIEFTDDDGESSITGVNLGIIKIKKDQQTSDK